MNTEPNNNQVNNTSYYMLPSGDQLEDFIEAMGMGFAKGSAVKYLWRAGKKDGESADKDKAKAEHYIKFLARVCPQGLPIVRRADDPQDYTDDMLYWRHAVYDLVEKAKTWRKGGVRG